MGVHVINKEQKEDIEERVTDFLRKRHEIVFAYLHGSFLEGNFRDIDVAVYLTEISKREALQYELHLEDELGEFIGFLTDVRVLNYAPLSFKFSVIKNKILLFSQDEGVRCDFECLTIVEYHDFDFLRSIYRKEALGLKV
jgi:Nucleotidyltransferase domain.